MSTDDLYAGDDSSGLLTHFVGRVKTGVWSTFFAETEGKASGDFAHNTLLFWHCDILDILQANYESSGTPVETILTNFGIGNGWHQDPDNPNLVEHEDDTEDYKKKFHGSSALMKFVYLISGQASTYEGAIPLDGDGQLPKPDLQGVRKVHAEKGVKTLRDATIWNGLIFEFRGIGFKTRNNPDPRAKPLPVRYMGYDESDLPDLSKLSGASGTSTNNSAGAPQSALGSVPTAVAFEWSQAGASDPTVALLTKLWERSPSIDHFVANAGMLPDVKGNEALATAVTNTEAIVAATPEAADVKAEG